ncbi:hypothetical protein EVAR_86587_1 [Eumeta japonica]|uniref:Uncharacterized protein n=1 Tax=Eumeta variegata TaxID=151549 RepID=A0A4C1W2J7_EUMVA|nr:hypothetical protein EVAR_86587_1 [Eumeta japonica]
MALQQNILDFQQHVGVRAADMVLDVRLQAREQLARVTAPCRRACLTQQMDLHGGVESVSEAIGAGRAPDVPLGVREPVASALRLLQQRKTGLSGDGAE